MKDSKLNDLINPDTLPKQDQKLLQQKLQKTQSKITAELLDPELSCAFLNRVSSSFKSKKEGRL
jgi:hypothetical protein